MDRLLPTAYQQARERLEAELGAAGYRLAAETFLPDAFGSADAEYVRRGGRLRLIWDGKDRWLWCQVAATPDSGGHPAPGEWRDLETQLGLAPTGRMLRVAEVIADRIDELERAVRQYLSPAA